MRTFLFRLRVMACILIDCLVQLGQTGSRRWAFVWFYRDARDLWRRNLQDHHCCSGFDTYGQVGCGCRGISWREYWQHYVEKG